VLAFWAALGNSATWIALFILLLLSGFFYQFTKLKIEVTSDVIKVGRANIAKTFLGDIEILKDDQMKHLRGPGINPSAFLALRFWVRGGVKINIADPRDPTPYWLVSTKDPEKVIKAIKD